MTFLSPLPWQRNRRLSEFSTFGIGGPISLFLPVEKVSQMQEALHYAQKQQLPFLVIGKGSNCLFDDRGFDGVVVQNKISFCDWSNSIPSVHVGAGYSFAMLGSQSAKRGLSGLEFASGIPASVGGAVFMNAGANGRETKDSLRKVEYITSEGDRIVYETTTLSFGYRSSPFQAMDGVIVSAHFELTPSLQARDHQLELINDRIKKQPLKEKSAGCVFRNPSSQLSAGALIEQCGLKGFRVGGAKVSEIHANFIVNDNQATANEVIELIEKIRQIVREKSGIELEQEIWIVRR